MDTDKKMDAKRKGVNDMATLTRPCKTPFIIREDRTEAFFEKCRNSGLSMERKQELLKCARASRKKTK